MPPLHRPPFKAYLRLYRLYFRLAFNSIIRLYEEFETPPYLFALNIIVALCTAVLLTSCAPQSAHGFGGPLPPATLRDAPLLAQCPKFDGSQTDLLLTQNAYELREDKTVVLLKSIKLPSQCPQIRKSFLLQEPDIVFDCNQNIINGMSGEDIGCTRSWNSALKKTFCHFYGELPIESAFRLANQNQVIKNCHIKNYQVGVSTQSIPDRISKSTLFNLIIENSTQNGISVGAKNHHNTIDHVTVKNSGQTGILFSPYSHGNVLTSSQVMNNGYWNWINNSSQCFQTGANACLVESSADTQHEGLAIASSQDNLVAHNTFRQNARGGISLFKICWEQNPMGASYNVIRDNLFEFEPRGVWIAARADRDVRGLSCKGPSSSIDQDFTRSIDQDFTRDPKNSPIDIGSRLPNPPYYLDVSNHNLVQNNEFHSVKRGITIQDHSNTASYNQFEGAADIDIEVGSLARELKKDPLHDIWISENTRGSAGASCTLSVTHSSQVTEIDPALPPR